MKYFDRNGANQNIDPEYVKMAGGLSENLKEDKPDFAFEKKIAICESLKKLDAAKEKDNFNAKKCE